MRGLGGRGTLSRYFGGCYTSTSPLVYTHRVWKVSIYIFEGWTGYCEGGGWEGEYFTWVLWWLLHINIPPCVPTEFGSKYLYFRGLDGVLWGGWARVGRVILCLGTLVATTHEDPPGVLTDFGKYKFLFLRWWGVLWGGWLGRGYFVQILWWLLHINIPLVYPQRLESKYLYLRVLGVLWGGGWEGDTLPRNSGGCYTSIFLPGVLTEFGK